MPIIGVQFRRDSSESWEQENPVLAPGEIGLEVKQVKSDGSLVLYENENEGESAFKIKLGDGGTPWNELPYTGGVRGPQGKPGKDGVDGKDGKDGRDGVDGERGEPGPSVAISDSVTSEESTVAASSKAVKTAYDLAENHEHNGEHITSGIVPAEHGGTGRDDGKTEALATARNISISGGATAKAVAFDGSADVALNVTGLDVSKAAAGVLPIKHGGTGANTAQAAAQALGAVTALNIASSGAGNVLTDVTSTKNGTGVTLTFSKASVVNTHCTYCTHCGYCYYCTHCTHCSHCSYCNCNSQCGN